MLLFDKGNSALAVGTNANGVDLLLKVFIDVLNIAPELEWQIFSGLAFGNICPRSKSLILGPNAH